MIRIPRWYNHSLTTSHPQLNGLRPLTNRHSLLSLQFWSAAIAPWCKYCVRSTWSNRATHKPSVGFTLTGDGAPPNSDGSLHALVPIAIAR